MLLIRRDFQKIVEARDPLHQRRDAPSRVVLAELLRVQSRCPPRRDGVEGEISDSGGPHRVEEEGPVLADGALVTRLDRAVGRLTSRRDRRTSR